MRARPSDDILAPMGEWLVKKPTDTPPSGVMYHVDVDVRGGRQRAGRTLWSRAAQVSDFETSKSASNPSALRN